MVTKILISICFILITLHIAAQQRFFANLELPSQMDTRYLTLAYDNGKEEIAIKNEQIKNNKLFISDLFYSKYATLILRYFKDDSHQSMTHFFLTTKSARIVIYNSDTSLPVFDKYRLVNAIDFKEEKLKLSQFNFREYQEYEDYFALAEKQINQGDTAAVKKWNEKFKILDNRNLEFITQNSNSYFSFWFFRRNTIKSNSQNPDSLLHIFNTIFPDEFKLSGEGYFIKKFLEGETNLAENKMAPAFTARDISGNEISLGQFKGKNNVLLIFWATWCGPCMQEVPIIKSIHEKNSPQKVKLISVSYDTDYPLFKKTISGKGMNWTNIYHDIDVINAYGGLRGIPRVYLINKSGKITYSSIEEHDIQLVKLKQLLETM